MFSKKLFVEYRDGFGLDKIISSSGESSATFEVPMKLGGLPTGPALTVNT